MTRLIISLGFLFAVNVGSLLSQELVSSSSSEKPSWIAHPPRGYQNDYFVGEGESHVSLPEASKEALGNAVTKIIQTHSFEASSSIRINNIQDGEQITKKVVEELTVNGSSITIKGLVQEESYYETWSEPSAIVTRSWVLVRIPKTKNFRDPPTAFSPVWRSIVPGWAQFYKGQPTKGAFIIGGEALLIPAGIILGNLKINADANAQSSRTQALRDYYVDQSNTYNNLSLASFIVAGVGYVYNRVDAIVSEGDKVYVVNEQKTKPTLTMSGRDIRIGLSVRF
jgi:uncharacterized Zn ribbon protein